MPWYIALTVSLFLFLLAPFFRKWVDLVVWPKIADWWATRSRSKTQERIDKLHGVLCRIESLPLLTEFEEMVMRAFAGVTVLLMELPTLGFLAYLMVFSGYRPFVKGSVIDLGSIILLALLLLLFDLMAIGVARALDKFRRERSSEYRQFLKVNIEELKGRLS
jgi:hypothetical protein